MYDLAFLIGEDDKAESVDFVPALAPNELARMSQLVSADVELIVVAAPVGSQGFYRAAVREK